LPSATPARSPICSGTPAASCSTACRSPTRGGPTSTSAFSIDELELQIAALTVQLKREGADHRYIPLLVTAPGIGWINAFTIASEIGDIGRFPSPAKLCGYTGLCPRVRQSGGVDARGPLSKHGPKYLRWALFEAALNACEHPYYAERYQHTKRRLGRKRGPKVAQIDLARRLTESIWHMLTRNQPFAPAGATVVSSP
jgi:transposase